MFNRNKKANVSKELLKQVENQYIEDSKNGVKKSYQEYIIELIQLGINTKQKNKEDNNK